MWIDIAGKATGLFARQEIIDEEPPAEGDQFIATVASSGVRGGMLMLSRLPIILEESRKVLEAASQSGEPVKGFVTGAVKGGLEVDLGGLRAFAPASHVDLRHGADLNYLVGQRLDFIVTQYAKKGRDIVVSRRKMLEGDAQKLRAEALTKIEPGSIHKGIVRKVVAWGVFVALPDAGHVEGLIHMTEASHDRGARLMDLFKPGQEIEVKVLKVDEKGKLWLSRKAVVSDPWDAVKEKYAVGTRHTGKVARLQPFGAFIELEPGIDGLIHAADLSIADRAPARGGQGRRRDRGHRRHVRQPEPPHQPAPRAPSGHRGRGSAADRPVQGRQGGRHAGHRGRPRGARARRHRARRAGLHPRRPHRDAARRRPSQGLPARDAARCQGAGDRSAPRRGQASIRALKEDAEKHAYQTYRQGVAREAKFGTFADLMKKS